MNLARRKTLGRTRVNFRSTVNVGQRSTPAWYSWSGLVQLELARFDLIRFSSARLGSVRLSLVQLGESTQLQDRKLLAARKPSSSAGIRFLELLEKDEMAFDNLYCLAFQMMDAQWLAKRASYMEFNDVLKSTRAQLERELKLKDVSCVKDLPAYNLLHR
ncbi:hypothetical protein KPL70_012241 [Citrus sinensis]|nr:hypothetical protein KPL70_012241 [Citrus sinensis]